MIEPARKSGIALYVSTNLLQRDTYGSQPSKKKSTSSLCDYQEPLKVVEGPCEVKLEFMFMTALISQSPLEANEFSIRVCHLLGGPKQWWLSLWFSIKPAKKGEA